MTVRRFLFVLVPTMAGEHRQENGLVFTSTIGTPMEPRNVTRRAKQLRGRAGLPWPRPHDPRHACTAAAAMDGFLDETAVDKPDGDRH